MAVFIGLALLLAAYYFPQLVQGRQYFISDHTYFFEPFAEFIAQGWASQRLPLWNPYIYCGSPQLANPSPGIFYLPNILFGFFPYSKALALILLFHQLVAYLGGYYLSRLMRFSGTASCFVGLTVALSGYFFSLPANYTLPATFAWGMLAFYGLYSIKRSYGEKIAGTISGANQLVYLGYVALSALFVHFMLMAGRPEIYVPFFVIFAFLIAITIARGRRSALPVVVWQIVAIVLGVLLSMVMLLPVAEWTRLSPRSTGLDFNQIFNWSSNWYDYLGLLLNQPLGDLQQPHTTFGGLVASRAAYYPFLPSAYIGPVAIALVFYGLCDRTFKPRFLIFAAALVAVLLAMGKYGPLSLLVLKVVPFFTVLRYPVKLLIFVILFLAILAGRGLHALEEGQRSVVARNLNLTLWLTGIAIGALFYFAAPALHGLAPLYPAAFYVALSKPIAAMSSIGLLVTAFISWPNLKIEKGSFSLVILAALVGSLAVPAFQCKQKTASNDYFNKNGFLVQRLKSYNQQLKPGLNGAVLPPRVITVYFDPLKMPPSYEKTKKFAAGEAYMSYCREMLLPNTSLNVGQPITFGYESAETKDFRSTYMKTLHASSIDRAGATDKELAKFLKLTSTAYVASHIIGSGKKGPVRLLNPQFFKVLEEDETHNLRLYQVIDSLPRAYVASSWQRAEQKKILDEITKADVSDCFRQSGTFVEADTRLENKAEIERPEAAVSPGELPLPQNESAGGKSEVKILQDNPEHVALSVQCEKEGLMVLCDRFYPGWYATIDSVPATIYRANGFMKSVYLAKGSHLVEFDYRPDSLRYGFYLAAFALVSLLIIFFFFIKAQLKMLFNFLTTGSFVRPSDKVSEEQKA
jgi:hypothetical protein